MKIFAGTAFFVGIMILAGVAGNADFYDACLAAADCVAGDPPSTFWAIIQSIIGLILLLIGTKGLIKE